MYFMSGGQGREDRCFFASMQKDAKKNAKCKKMCFCIFLYQTVSSINIQEIKIFTVRIR